MKLDADYLFGFLPDYQQKLDEWLASHNGEFARGFAEKYFHEAVAGLLKAQREECESSWHSAIAEIDEPYFESVSRAILNAPIPIPENETKNCE